MNLVFDVWDIIVLVLMGLGIVAQPFLGKTSAETAGCAIASVIMLWVYYMGGLFA